VGLLFQVQRRKSPLKAKFWPWVQAKKLENGSIQSVDLKVGDKVLFGQYAGSTVKVDGEELLVMSESEVFGVVE